MCLPQVLDRPSDHLPRARRALDGAAAGLNVVENVGAQAEGVGWARALCLAQWTGALGAAMCLWMRASVGHAFARSLRDSLRPRDHVHVGRSGQFRPIGAKRDRSRVRHVARAKCKKCIGSCLSIPHSSVFNMLKVTVPVADI